MNKKLIRRTFLVCLILSPFAAFGAELRNKPRDAAKEQFIQDLLKKMGLTNMQILVVRDDASKGKPYCAYAAIEEGRRIIGLNPDCTWWTLTRPNQRSTTGNFSREEQLYWYSVSYLTHEVSHHVQQHYSTTTIEPPIEQDRAADGWVGFALNRYFGATLEEALLYAVVGQQEPTLTHMGREERAKVIERGWRLAAGQPTNPGILSALPVSAPAPTPQGQNNSADSLAALARRQLQALRRP